MEGWTEDRTESSAVGGPLFEGGSTVATAFYKVISRFMSKHAKTDHPIHELLRLRWSPYGFHNKSVPAEDLCALFEAARWAPSSYNEQPWRYIVATRDESEAHGKILSCLVDANQEWAQAAPVLALGVVSLTFVRNGKPNRAALHDLGAASAHLSFEATARGIFVHQMIGIHADKARELFGIPSDHEALTALAIGFLASPNQIAEKFQERDAAPRSRNPLRGFVFGTQWSHPADCLSD